MNISSDHFVCLSHPTRHNCEHFIRSFRMFISPTRHNCEHFIRSFRMFISPTRHNCEHFIRSLLCLSHPTRRNCEHFIRSFLMSISRSQCISIHHITFSQFLESTVQQDTHHYTRFYCLSNPARVSRLHSVSFLSLQCNKIQPTTGGFIVYFTQPVYLDTSYYIQSTVSLFLSLQCNKIHPTTRASHN